MKKLWHKWFGEPVWREHHDGEVAKSRLKRNGKYLALKKIYGWVRAYEDGTVHEKSNVIKWWPRNPNPQKRIENE